MTRLVMIREWFEEQANKKDLDEHCNYLESGYIDSFGLITLLEIIQSKFHITINEIDYENPDFFTISGLEKVVRLRCKILE